MTSCDLAFTNSAATFDDNMQKLAGSVVSINLNNVLLTICNTRSSTSRFRNKDEMIYLRGPAQIPWIKQSSTTKEFRIRLKRVYTEPGSQNGMTPLN
jgi:hypothetical protein